MMKSIMYAAVVALASAQTIDVDHKRCAKVQEKCIEPGWTVEQVQEANPGVDCHKFKKCCAGLVCAGKSKWFHVGECVIPTTSVVPNSTSSSHPSPTSSSHPSPTPSPQCVHKNQVCGHMGTGIPPLECCDKKNECRAVTEGVKGSVMTCQKKAPKCVRTGDQCGIEGTGKPTKKCCNKDSECRAVTEGIKGSVMTCQKNVHPTTTVTTTATKTTTTATATSTSTATTTTTSTTPCPHPTHTPVCNKTTGYMGPVQIRTDNCAAKVNDTIIFNTTCCDVKFNKTSQWWIYFTTGCGMNTEFQLVNGEEQVSVCDGHMNQTRAYFANDDICEANVTIFEHRHNYVDTFTLNVSVSVEELSQIIVNQTEAAVEMIVGDYYLAVNGTQPMYSAADAAENNTVFNIGVLSAFDVYYTN